MMVSLCRSIIFIPAELVLDEDYNQPQQRGGPSGLLAQLMGGGMGGGLNFGMHGFGAPLSAE
jgi:hypothetical protein